MKRTSVMAVLTSAIALLPAMAHAIPISGTGALGSFSGTFDYTPVSDTNGTVVVVLENTSDDGNGGFITAFVFNLPSGADVTSVGLSSTSATFTEVLGEAVTDDFEDNVNGAPFGRFDIGATTSGSFEGGGSPSFGIAVGSSVMFTFSLTGTGLGGLSADDFLNTLSVPPGAGQGVEDLVVRFRGFRESDPDSDKVPNTAVPEPSTVAVLGLGLIGLAARRATIARARRRDRGGQVLN